MTDVLQAYHTRNLSDHDTPVIKVRVGDCLQEFGVHADILQKSSLYLEAKVAEQNWKGSRQPILDLPQLDLYAFLTYRAWLYTGTLDNSTGRYYIHYGRITQRTPRQVHELKLWRLEDALTLAEQLQDSTYRDQVTKAIVSIAGPSRFRRRSIGKTILRTAFFPIKLLVSGFRKALRCAGARESVQPTQS